MGYVELNSHAIASYKPEPPPPPPPPSQVG